MAQYNYNLNPVQQANNLEVKGKWIFIAFICGIIITIISLALTIYSFTTPTTQNLNIKPGDASTNSSSSSILMILLIIFSGIVFNFFYFGFSRIGKYANSKSLKISSFIIMSTLTILIIFSSIILINSPTHNSSFPSPITGNAINNGIESDESNLGDLFKDFGNELQNQFALTVWAGIPFSVKLSTAILAIDILVMLIALFFFFTGLIKVSGEIKLAFPTGILGFIFTTISIIIYFILAYFLFQIISNPLYIFKLLLTIIGYQKEIIWTNRILTFLIFILILLQTILLFFAARKYEK